MSFEKSKRLKDLRYDIRGPVYEKALELEAQGYEIINLNIGNPAPFGFNAPDEIIHDIILNMRNGQGYAESRGLFAARKAVMHYTQTVGIPNVEVNDVFIGNGVSELIVIAMQALLNNRDEVLLPSPDYPLWTAAVSLAGGKPVHYLCDESSGWNPDLGDLESKITSRTKGIVIINPNNPTGAVYDREIVDRIAKIASERKLILFADEIYDKILYDGAVHHPAAARVEDTLCITLGGLSKNYRAAGFRMGWLIVSGAKEQAKSYIEGLTLLATMRLCANVPMQYGIQTALGGQQSINALVETDGRLYKQMNYVYERLSGIPGISCVRPKGSLYLFPKIEKSVFNFKDDREMIYQLLTEQRVLAVAGQGFNYTKDSHFRIVFLPMIDQLKVALDRITTFLDAKRKVSW